MTRESQAPIFLSEQNKPGCSQDFSVSQRKAGDWDQTGETRLLTGEAAGSMLQTEAEEESKVGRCGGTKGTSEVRTIGGKLEEEMPPV